jgi:PIN domain nuclease of toxin-antitoxin system
MIILLDTCDFLWFVTGSRKLPNKTREEIENQQNSVYLSVVSLWEIIVKESSGKLPLPNPAIEFVTEQRNRHKTLSLDLDEPSIKHLPRLPEVHRDPFDRMLICQALEHRLRLASSDPIMAQYPVILI